MALLKIKTGLAIWCVKAVISVECAGRLYPLLEFGQHMLAGGGRHQVAHDQITLLAKLIYLCWVQHVSVLLRVVHPTIAYHVLVPLFAYVLVLPAITSLTRAAQRN